VTAIPNKGLSSVISLRGIAERAKSTLGQTYRRGDLGKGVGTGLSIRARARLVLVSTFLVAAPALLIGVLRTQAASSSAQNVAAYENYERQATRARLLNEEALVQAWHLTARPEVERLREFQKQIAIVAGALKDLVEQKPSEFYFVELSRLNDAAMYLDNSQDDLEMARFQLDEGRRIEILGYLRLLLTDISIEMRDLDARVRAVADARMSSVISQLSKVGRDQLILFLLLLMAIPLFVLFAPGWVVAPMARLRALKHRIEEGHVRDIAVFGHDEVSQLARSLKSALAWREDFEQKKSAKIFEVRNVLRGIISHTTEAVLVIDRNDKVSFANDPAAKLLGMEQHYLEGSILTDHVFSPELIKAIDNAQSGDLSVEPLTIQLELVDGSERTCRVKMASVHDREGSIARVVIVLQAV